jgi:putative membrane protein
MALLGVQAEWEAAGHASPDGWPVLVGQIALAVLVALYAFLVVRALARRRRYRAVGVLSDTDVAAVHAALAAAERRTVGEILPVVLERSDRHPAACWLAALVTALVFSAALLPWIPGQHPALLIAAQLALGALGYGLARALPDFQRTFVSEARAEEMAEEQALQEFHRHDLALTRARTGVLIFVTLLERRVIVLADEGIDTRVDAEQWKRTDEAVLAGIARGSLRDGLVAGIASAGEVLAAHFPVEADDRDEIPDRVIVRRE